MPIGPLSLPHSYVYRVFRRPAEDAIAIREKSCVEFSNKNVLKFKRSQRFAIGLEKKKQTGTLKIEPSLFQMGRAEFVTIGNCRPGPGLNVTTPRRRLFFFNFQISFLDFNFLFLFLILKSFCPLRTP